MAVERPPGGGQWTPTPTSPVVPHPQPRPPANAPAPASGGGAGAQPLSAAGGTPVSKETWALALIQALGGTPTPAIIDMVVAWINGEGTRATWNPLATTETAPGATQFNPVGVQNFTSFQQGIDTTVKTLTNGRYPNIVAAIQTGDPNRAFAHPNEFDTWGTGGARVIGLYRQVSGDPNVGAQGLLAAGTGGTGAPGSSVQQYILQNDPSLDWALGVPELQAILTSADISTPAGVANLTAALTGSDYYRSHSSALRDWTALQGHDPETARRMLDATTAALRAEALSLGINLSENALSGLALSEHMFGWQPGGAEEHNALLAAGAFSQSGTLGAVGNGAMQAKQLFAEYGIKLDDGTAQTYGVQINTATNTTQALENLRPLAVAQAKGLYPNLAPLLDQGVTVENIFSPYRSDAAQLLSVDPSTIGLTDPKWSRLLEGDNKTGMMSRQQARATIQTDPIYHWDTSENGRSSAYALRDQLTKDFGVSA